MPFDDVHPKCVKPYRYDRQINRRKEAKYEKRRKRDWQSLVRKQKKRSKRRKRDWQSLVRKRSLSNNTVTATDDGGTPDADMTTLRCM